MKKDICLKLNGLIFPIRSINGCKFAAVMPQYENREITGLSHSFIQFPFYRFTSCSLKSDQLAGTLVNV